MFSLLFELILELNWIFQKKRQEIGGKTQASTFLNFYLKNVSTPKAPISTKYNKSSQSFQSCC